MRKPIIAGNWKMHMTIAEATRFVKQLPVMKQAADVVVCAPFTALSSLSEPLREKNIALGAQNVHWDEAGAYTGEISPVMLKEIGTRYVIIGHSERRTYFNETDETVNRRVLTALQHELIPIVCVGENIEQREAGQTETIVSEQIQAALNRVPNDQIERVVIAYEPIWAIGTGKTSSAEDANQVIATIRQSVARLFDERAAGQVRIQYGGSVNPENIKGFLAQPEIDGALVGGASLRPESFAALVEGVGE